jgi:hypothetical protein
MRSVEFAPGDVRIDVLRVPGDGPRAVRATHLASDVSVTVDDQATTEDNRNRALGLLRSSLSWDRSKPWTAPAHSLVLWRTGPRWRYAIHSEAGILDGGLGELRHEAQIDDAQTDLLRTVQEATGLVYAAIWTMDRPEWWSAELTQVTLA